MLLFERTDRRRGFRGARIFLKEKSPIGRYRSNMKGQFSDHRQGFDVIIQAIKVIYAQFTLLVH